MSPAEILARLEKAEGPDRELDLLIAQTISPDVIVLRQRDDDSGADPYTYWHYTASIDAAMALVEKALPGAWYTVGKGKLRDGEPLFGAHLLFGADELLGLGETDANLAIAILIALFRALSNFPAPEKSS